MPLSNIEFKAMLREISHDEHIRLAEQFSMNLLDFHNTVEPAAYFQQVPVTGEPLSKLFCSLYFHVKIDTADKPP